MTSAVESGEISLTLPDGSVRKVSAGTTGADLAMAISPRLAKAALAVVVDDRLTDLTRPFEADARVRIITERDPEALHLYRHSTAHLLAAAVLELFPGTQCGIGPALEDGFYYDFVVQRPFVPEDLAAIEQRMREIAARDLPFVRELRPKEDAKAFFAARGEPLKVELIEEKGGPIVSVYDIQGVFLDFCVGPHVPSVGKLGHFKLLSTSNAYWKGDAKNQPMQRVYGTAFFSKNELEQYLHRLEEAKKRDHRKLGKDLGLFHFHPWAPGAAFWLAKGTTVYHTIANYMRDVLLPNGYVELKTPLIFNKALWETSGHWQHYRQNMFLIDNDEEQMAMKAMNCPGHMLVFASETRSYRDLPLRFHEQTPLHRNEASGVLSGLTRVRQFSQDDAHCFVMESQIGEEVERLLRLVQRVYGDFGLEYSVKLSTRPAEFLGEIATWDHAEAELKRALDERRPGLHGRRRRRRLLRPEDRRRCHRRDRPEVAVRHDPARLPDAAALRPEVHRRRQRRALPSGDPPRDLRQLRALHGAAGRALRRGVPDVAGARAGDGAAAVGPPPRRRQGRRGYARGGRPPGHRRRAGRENRVQDSGSSAPADSVHAGAG